MTNKLFLSGLKLTGTWAVHTFVDLFGVNTVMCGVYIRKCCMMLPGLKLIYTCVIVAIVDGAKVNQCMCCVYIRMVGRVYV